MTFLSVRSQVCRWLPPDPFSRRRLCLKLGVIVTLTKGQKNRLFSSIWTLVLLQGTYTPLVHAHAGRTQVDEADGLNTLAATRKYLPPLTPQPVIRL
jgi:hypothetical protein